MITGIVGNRGARSTFSSRRGPRGTSSIRRVRTVSALSPVPFPSRKRKEARKLTPWTTDHKTQCPATNLGGNRCGNRLEKGQSYCKDHSCELGSCRNQRGFASLQYCEAHKCTVAACQQLRKNTIAGLDLASGSLRASLLLGGGGFLGGGDGGGALLMSSYCAAHACAGDAGRCGDRVAELGRSSFCPRHECCHRGCAKEATRQPRGRSSTAGYCDRHYQRRRAGGGGGMPGGPFGPMPMPMPMPMGMPMGFPPYFGGQGYDSSDSESESDGGRRPRGLPFGGLAF